MNFDITDSDLTDRTLVPPFVHISEESEAKDFPSSLPLGTE